MKKLLMSLTVLFSATLAQAASLGIQTAPATQDQTVAKPASSDSDDDDDDDNALNEVRAIRANVSHTCALSKYQVKCWGNNYYGQLGDNSTHTRLTPVDVVGIDGKVDAISGGDYHSCALVKYKVMCWGLNAYGQLGNNSHSDSHVATNVWGLGKESDIKVKAIASGLHHNCVLTNEGEVKCWGRNNKGQLGNGSMTDSLLPVSVAGLDDKVEAIAAGAYHTCALVKEHGVKCWGFNGSGQLGNNSKVDSNVPVDVAGLDCKVKDLSIGGTGYHSCAITEEGKAMCWGANWYGQLGDNTTVGRDVPVPVVGLPGKVSSISAGFDHTCAVTEKKETQCWGAGNNGQLGNGSTNGSLTPVSVADLGKGVSAVSSGEGYNCAITSKGVAKCWGNNCSGQLGDNSTITRLTPVSVFDLDDAGEGDSCH